MSVLTNADAKRMYGQIATRASRGAVLLSQAQKSAKVKRPGVQQLQRIRKLTQEAMAQFTSMVDIIEELAD